jgi:phosphomevalonate kinase
MDRQGQRPAVSLWHCRRRYSGVDMHRSALWLGDTWQLVINTGTTIVTFLMVFLIQNTQNLDSEAMQVKLDELIRAVDGAHNALLDLEELEEDELDSIRSRYRRLAERAREDLRQGSEDTGSPLTDDSVSNTNAPV